MDVRASLIINSFCRPHLLKWGLWSLAKQNLPLGLEVIVINDGLPDETEALCNTYRSRLNIRYIFTGRRNLNLEGKTRWRIPGFGINYAVKKAQGEIIILSCAEMFHLNDTIGLLVKAVEDHPKHLGIPSLAKDDRDGSFLHYLENHQGGYDSALLLGCRNLNASFPFLLSMGRKEFIDIGGYDEDFWGMGFDDDDLMGRLRLKGCQYVSTGAQTIHLYHPRYYREGNPGWSYNRNLYLARRGVIVRNQDREWGKG